jgi:hypothetical protein
MNAAPMTDAPGGALTIRLRCRHLPGTRFEQRTDVRLGVQRGPDVVDDVAAEADREEVIFDLPVQVAVSPRTGTSDFKGRFVHGKPGERFLYLCWGERRSDQWEGFRRAKVPLRDLNPVLLDRAQRAGAIIETALEMTDRGGGPVSGSFHEGEIAWTLPSGRSPEGR